MVKQQQEYDGSTPLKDTRRELFCHNRANGMTQAEAYREAGYSENGDNGNACRLIAHDSRIRQRITHLTEELAKELRITREGQAKKLEWVQLEAKESKDFSNYTRAVEVQSKHFGLMTDVVRDDSAESELAKSRRKEALEMAREAAKVIKIRKEA